MGGYSSLNGRLEGEYDSFSAGAARNSPATVSSALLSPMHLDQDLATLQLFAAKMECNDFSQKSAGGTQYSRLIKTLCTDVEQLRAGKYHGPILALHFDRPLFKTILVIAFGLQRLLRARYMVEVERIADLSEQLDLELPQATRNVVGCAQRLNSLSIGREYFRLRVVAMKKVQQQFIDVIARQ